MIDWVLSQIQTLATIGFCVGSIAILALVVAGWRYHVSWAYKYAGALALAVLFFFLFTVFIGSVRFFAFWLAAFTFWGSVILTVIAVVYGLLRQNYHAFVLSAILAIPFTFYLFLSPGTRAAILLPLVLLACAGIVRWLNQRTEQQNRLTQKIR